MPFWKQLGTAFAQIAVTAALVFYLGFTFGTKHPRCDLTNAHPVIHDFKMNAGGNNVSAD